jgi:RHS repeat-associated protein
LIDADPGLYYLRARYYDPEIGRFISQDPLPGGITGMLARSGLKHLARYIPVDVGGCAPQAAAASLVVGTNYSKE